MMPALTAILCNYNYASQVGRAIEAMLSQSRPPDELIIVDDASTDDSRAVIERYAAGSSRVRFLQNERNLGWHGSSARALALATGDYVYNGAADDYVLPGFFESVCGLMDRHPQAGVGCAKVVTALPDGRHIRSDGIRRWTEAVYLSPLNFLHDVLDVEPPTHSLSSATIYRREWLLKVGGWRIELGSWADTFAIRAIGLQTGLCYAPRDGAVWLINPTGMSQSTMSNPTKVLKLLRQAAALMRSPEFAPVFPADHVDRWEDGYVEALVTQQLQPAIDGYQAVQQVCRQTAAQSSWPVRCLLGVIRRLMTACYLVQHHMQRRVIRRRLRELEARGTGDEGRASTGHPDQTCPST